MEPGTGAAEWPQKALDWLTASPWHIAVVVAVVVVLIVLRLTLWVAFARIRVRLVYGRRPRRRGEH